jgi:tRNA/tmRNA/rRNA uracil-C5-methylase (TrmA/RlmC/RlmD family)
MYQDDDGTLYDIILSHVPFAVLFSLFRRKQLYMFLTKGRRQWEWRCRAKLAVRGTSMDPQIGLFEEGSHFVVDIPSCRGGLLSITAG